MRLIAAGCPAAELGESMTRLVNSSGGESLLVDGVVVDDPLAPELTRRVEVELGAAPEGFSLTVPAGVGQRRSSLRRE